LRRIDRNRRLLLIRNHAAPITKSMLLAASGTALVSSAAAPPASVAPKFASHASYPLADPSVWRQAT
jgi:hypothetical protein